jgi:quinohemoprotein ethanol dehydrogenase
VPGDEWDYDVTNPLMTADIMVNGRMRHVLMQAPKIAFYYIWDAKTGELLSAEKFAPANWAFSIDLKTGRPVENKAARYDKDTAALVYPAALGAHNWHPMSFSPRTNLVYIPVTERAAAYQGQDPANFVMRERTFNTGQTSTPATTALFNAPGAPPRQGPSYLQAWNPTTGKEAWRVPNAVFGASGTMVTASDIVFSGNYAGEFVAYDARNGRKLWSDQVQARIQAAPATYTIDGEQYVAILAGSQGGLPTGVQRTSALSVNNSRILVYKIGGTAKLPTAAFSTPVATPGGLNPPRETATNEQVIDGENTYGRYCFTCHGQSGVGGGSGPDLRYSRLLSNPTEWNNVVMNGAKATNGMPSFRGTIQPDDSVNLLAYVVRRANQGAQEMAAAAAGRGGGRGGPPPGAAPPAGGRGPAPAGAPPPARGGRGG